LSLPSDDQLARARDFWGRRLGSGTLETAGGIGTIVMSSGATLGGNPAGFFGIFAGGAMTAEGVATLLGAAQGEPTGFQSFWLNQGVAPRDVEALQFAFGLSGSFRGSVGPGRRACSGSQAPGSNRSFIQLEFDFDTGGVRVPSTSGASPAVAPIHPTFEPGPFAVESIPARSPARDFTAVERAEIDRIGNIYGCHTCGTRDPGTLGGGFILDHQPVSALNSQNLPQRLFPQCLNCSRNQGLAAARALRGQP